MRIAGTLHVYRVIAHWVVVWPLVYLFRYVLGAVMLSLPDVTVEFPTAIAELDEYLNGKQSGRPTAGSDNE